MKEHPAHDRRSFLKAVGVTGGAAALLSELPATTAEAAGPVPAAASTSGEAKFMLTLDDTQIGVLLSALGGMPSGALETDGDFAEGTARKHIGGVKYEDIKVSIGTGIHIKFHQWIADSMEGKMAQHSGTVVAFSRDLMEHSRLQFTEALITEVGLPALDAASKDAAKMTIKLTPSSSRYTIKYVPMNKPVATKQKQWLCSNFRLKIDGLNCTRVSKIDAITIKCVNAEGAVDPLGPSTVIITVPEADAPQFLDWFEDMVLNSNDNEKQGSIEWLAPDKKTVLGSVTLGNLGLFRVSPEAVSGQNSIRRVKAEMYCEHIKYSTFLPS